MAPPPAAAAPAAPNVEDSAYAAFQRGHYKTALTIATQRVEQNDDVKAMALLGELYAGGLGVMQDDSQGRRRGTAAPPTAATATRCSRSR